MDTLELYGWNNQLSDRFSPHLGAGLEPARVVSQHRDRWRLVTASGACDGILAGRARLDGDAVPAVGDWVVVESQALDGPRRIRAILERTSLLSRRAAGSEGEAQVVAANVDDVLVVAPLDRPLSPRWLERALALAFESGALPHVVLTKADACEDPAAAVASAQEAALAVDVHLVSAHAGTGFEALDAVLAPGRTLVLVGASGAGKSTLLNRWLGEARAEVGDVREEDQKGRHTTTHRELFPLPGGALVIDTPGIRELGLWLGEEGLERVFADVESFAAACRFSDCTHESEPGCAVRAAVEAGELSADRVEHLKALGRERDRVAAEADVHGRLERKRKEKLLSRAVSAYFKLKH